MNDNPPSYEEVIEGKPPPSAPCASDVPDSSKTEGLLSPQHRQSWQAPPEPDTAFICDRESNVPPERGVVAPDGSERTDHDHSNYPAPRLPEDGPPTNFWDKLAFVWAHYCPHCSGREMDPSTRRVYTGGISN